MQDTGERQIPKTPGTLEGLDIKHVQRYEWARSFTYHKRVYDIACGVGFGTRLLAASQYVGFDNSGEAIEYAKAYYSSTEAVRFEVADACAMPAEITQAEVIVSFETIEHLKDPEAFLKWCANHTQTLLISSPIRNSFGRSPWHLFEYRLAQFTDVLKKYFTQVEMSVQKLPEGIIYPARPQDKGVAIAVCHV